MNARQLIHTQLRLECIGVDRTGSLVRIPGPDPDSIARGYVYRCEGSYLLLFRADLPAAIRRQIEALGPERAFHDHAQVRALLASHSPCSAVFAGQTHTLPDTLGTHLYPDVVRLTEKQRSLIEAYHPGMDVSTHATHAAVSDGKIVSTCGSSRENDEAGEAYVYTLPAYRGRGYGRQATAAWAHHLQQVGKIPFYSHAWTNLSSQAVAKRLQLQPRFALVNYE